MSMKRKRTRRSTQRGRRRSSRAVGVGQVGGVVVPLALIPALAAAGKAAGLGAAGVAGRYTANRVLQKLFKSKNKTK